MYDQHSSEEELEVINGPLATSPVPDTAYKNGSAGSGGTDTDASPKRCCSSTLLEKRKRSLAHNSDDEVKFNFCFVFFYYTHDQMILASAVAQTFHIK